MVKYHRIGLDDRENIYLLKNQGVSNKRIAKILGFDKSNIGRELKRNHDLKLGYVPDRAEKLVKSRRQKISKINKNQSLAEHITAHLKLGWSPDEIAGRLKKDGKKGREYACAESIYSWIFSEEGRKFQLTKLLFSKKKVRKRRANRKPKKSTIPNATPISDRPKIISKNKEIGHFEGDLVLTTSLKSANITTFVERKTGFALLIFNRSKYTHEVIENLHRTIFNEGEQNPKFLCKSITFDRWTEFAAHQNLGVPTYFCNPHSPWQKGRVENFNGRLRRFIPKKYKGLPLSQQHLDDIQNKMNNTPRKFLKYRTPLEALNGQ